MQLNPIVLGNYLSSNRVVPAVGVRTLAKQSEFDKLLVSAIDDALGSLGESVKRSIYFHIENKFKVTRNEIPKNLEEFQGGLEKIFGAGALFIEIQIMKNLHRKIGLPLKMESENFEFVEYVGTAKKSFLLKAN
jgi:hypothetical protein